MVAVADLIKTRDGELGDVAYYDPSLDEYGYANNYVYILKDGDTANTPILIQDYEGQAAYGLYSDYSYGDSISTRQVQAVESAQYTNSSGNLVDGYAIAIVSVWGWVGDDEDDYQYSYETVYADGNGILDWSTSTYTTEESALVNAEPIFGEDFSGDGYIGFNESSLTQKTTDVIGEKLFLDSFNNLYIKPEVGDLIAVVDPYNGDSISIDYYDDWGDGYSSEEALKVTLWDNDTASDPYDDKYLVLAQNSYSSGDSYTSNDFVIYKIELDGKMDWMSEWNPSLSGYELDFGEDLNSDGVIGVNTANISYVSSDTSDSTGTRLKKDSVDGTLYIDDAGTELKIIDEWGGAPHVEYSHEWGTTSAVAVEKKSDGTFCLAVKSVENYGSSPGAGAAGAGAAGPGDPTGGGDTGGSENENISWSIYTLTDKGNGTAELSYMDTTWTDSISSYEVALGQDLNGDGDIGVNLSNLTAITTDTVGNQLKKDTDGAIYITDASGNNPLAITYEYGGNASFEWSYSWEDGSFKSEVIAVQLIDAPVGTDDYYNLAVKMTDTYGSEENINWEIYKIKLDGVIDWSGSSYTNSITPWEGPSKFNQDLNGDGNSSGTVTVVDYGVDIDGATLGKADGALYIRDEDGTDILINDGWIEGSSNWGDGSWSATAVGVDKHADGYYQLAVKNTNTYRDYWSTGEYNSTAELVTSSDWQIYAIDATGNVLWDKTSWSPTIGSFELAFNQDLDGDGVTGIDQASFTDVTTDTFGWKLKKDSSKSLYVTDADGNNLVSLGDTYGTINFDYEYNWGSGSSKSEAIAAEKKSDGTFCVVVKNTGSDNWDGYENNWTDYQIVNFDSSGIIDWYSSYNYTQDIKPYETDFGQDLDGDGAIGLDVSALVDAGTDTFGDVLKKDSTGNSFYILDDSTGQILSITEDWGGSADLEYSSSWDGGSWKQEAIAVESLTYTNKYDESINGFVIAIKNTSIYDGENWCDWELKYTNEKGIIDWEMSTWTSSIKSSEILFGAGQDLDGDGATGISAAALTDISTDTVGATLKKDSENTLYISDGANIILIADEWGGTTSFDYSMAGGTGSDAWAYSSSAYAVEKFDDGGTTKYLLAIKNEDTFGSSTTKSWQTYKIKEKNVGDGDWYLDWMSSSWSKGISKKESIFNQDLNGNGSIDSTTSIATTKIATDTSDAGITGAQLSVDSEGALYIVKDNTKIAIVDSQDNAVNFDWQYSWGDFTNKAESYAVEGIANSDGTAVEKYKLAIKHSETDSSTGIEIVNWETIQIGTDGIVNWSSFTWGESDIHEQDLGQDLDGDGLIWTTDNLTFTPVATDTTGLTIYLDENQYAYVQEEGTTTKKAILDEAGNLISFSDSYSFGDFSTVSSLYSAQSDTVGGEDVYRLLIKHEDTYSGTITNFWETINVVKSTQQIDWSSSNWYDDPQKLEQLFNDPDLDGVTGLFEINATNTTPITTDIIGAQLRQSTDGSLFIKDGDNTITVKSPDGGYVDFDYSETFTSGSFVTKAIAAQKVGDDYKIVVEETTTLTGSETNDTFYTVYKLDSTGTLNWGDIVYRTAAELNENEFGQDIDGDGTISSGSATSASDTYADLVSTGTTDAVTLTAIQNTAQSDIFSIANADADSIDTDIEMYVEGIEGTAKGNYDVDVKVVQTANDSLIAKAAADTGLAASDFNALTGVMDFSVTIADQDNYGKIVSMSWVLPEGTENPKYYKKDVVSGEYFDFVYDQISGEGAQWDPTTRTLKVSVRDNGKYDSNNTLGIVKDPGFISSGKDTTNPTLPILFPANNATAAPNNANFELTFSEKVDVKTGNIVIKKVSDDSVVDTIDVTSALVTGTGTNKITVNPAADLALGTDYYIQIDTTAFDDKSGNSFAGISDKTTFTFKTASTDLAPTLISATPADDATSASHLSNIALSFSEAVTVVSGNVVIKKKADDSIVETIAITSDLVTGTGTNIITINPSVELESGTEYYVQIDSTALKDSADNTYAGISDKVTLSFTTSPYLFTSTDSEQVIAYTGKSYAQSTSDITIGSLTYKIYSFDGEISADKYYNVKSVYSTSINEAANENVTLNSRALDFQLTIQTPEDATVGESSLVVFDTSLVADGLSVTDGSNNRDVTKFWTYYSIDDSGTISALNYDPIKNAGAKFFDTSGDGIADAVHLELIDGGYGDKDGEVNGVIKDPSVAGTATLDPDFVKVDATTLNIVDSTKTTTPATFVLNAALDLTTRTSTVDEIGYVVLNSGESTLTIDQFKTRAKTLFNSLENSDVTLTNTTSDLYSQELFIANNQSINLFKISDASISDITALTDSRLSYFSIDSLAADSTSMKTSDGLSLTLTTTNVDPGIDELIGNLQSESSVLDFASVPEKLGSVSGTLEYAREANYDSVIGFYRVVDKKGSVIDSVTGNVVTTSDANYKDYALATTNLVTELADISIADDQSASKNITVEENSIIAPYALSNGETLFAFGDANSDGISHFKSFGTNSFGLEDTIGGGDKDYDDFIIKFDFNSER